MRPSRTSSAAPRTLPRKRFELDVAEVAGSRAGAARSRPIVPALERHLVREATIVGDDVGVGDRDDRFKVQG